MKKIVLLMGVLLTGAGMVHADAESNLVAQLNALSSKANQLPESLVRPASLLVQQRYLDKPWKQVRAELVKQGLAVPKGRERQYSTLYEVPVATEVLKTRDIPFDLVLEFVVDKRTKEMVSTARHGHVITTTASLRADVGVATTKLLSASVFPTNSVLGRALAAPVRRKSDGGHPVLKRIEMSYDLIRAHRESEWPYGYHLTLNFGDESNEDWRKSVYLTVLSSEDLPRDQEHRVVKNWQGWMFTGLEDIHYWGGAER